jgi:hypothetical protein
MWNPNKAIFLTGLWGLNSISKNENAILLEAAYKINRLTLYSRYEWIQKSTEELDLEPVLYGNTLFRVNSFTLGFNINIIKISKTWLAFGSHATVYNADKNLNELYGKNPVGFEMYFRVTPDNMTMAD